MSQTDFNNPQYSCAVSCGSAGRILRPEEVMPSVVRQVTHSKYTKCKQLRDALLIAITHCYAIRLNLGKNEFRDAVCRCWSWARFKGVDDEFFATPDGEEFWEPYDYITGFIVNQLHLEVSIARKVAIRENTFALFVGMCIRTATFIVGKPGSSKSLFLSLDLLTGMMLNREHPFW